MAAAATSSFQVVSTGQYHGCESDWTRTYAHFFWELLLSYPKPFSTSHPRRLASLACLLSALAACTDSTTAPLDPPEYDARLQRIEVTVAQPSQGDTLSGVYTVRVALSGAAHSVTWQLDWGVESTLVRVPGTDWWTAEVDTRGWTANGAGPYTLAFRAWDDRHRKKAEQTRTVYVAVASTPPIGGGGDTSSPLAGARLWVDPNSNARKQATTWLSTRPADADLMSRMAERSQADWFGDWSGDVRNAVAQRTAAIAADGAFPVYVAYNLPLRDCNSYSAGGASSPDAYKNWIRAFTAGLGGRRALVVLEPDGLAQLDCMTQVKRDERLALLRDAVSVLSAAGVVVYIDAGHPRWHPADVMADRLRLAGVAGARGFSVNVSNFVVDSENVTYGRAISDRLAGVSFVVDSSRNGMGPAPDGAWCNPDGRGLGTSPTLAPGLDRVDAFLWIKRPGESDGSCNGAPSAGSWWADYALGLASRAADL